MDVITHDLSYDVAFRGVETTRRETTFATKPTGTKTASCLHGRMDVAMALDVVGELLPLALVLRFGHGKMAAVNNQEHRSRCLTGKLIPT